MPKYTVTDYFDVWGNAVDGYEVNNQSSGPEVMIRGEATDEQFVKALIEAGALAKNALALFEDGELMVGDDGGDGIEISERETAWSRQEGHGDTAYVEDSDAYLAEDYTPEQVAAEEGEGEPDDYAVVVGHRPILGLHPEYNELDAKPFWRDVVETYGERFVGDRPGAHEAVLELRAAPEKLEGHRKTPVKGHKSYGVLKVEAHVDGEYFGTFDFPDDFENDTPLGLAVHGGVVALEEGGDVDIQELKVALDVFMDRGGVGAPAFLKVKPYEAR